MAPEQCIGATVEARTDIYALGFLMYEAVTGELPIVAQNRRELLDLHQRQIPMSMRQRRPDLPIPEGLDAAVMRCLKKRMNERPRSAGELEQMLLQVPPQGLPTSYPPGTSRRAPPPARKPPAPTTVDPDARTIPGFTNAPSPARRTARKS
jgi:serine/threonine-protein kinase